MYSWAIALPRTHLTFEESGERCVQGPSRWLEKSTRWNENRMGTGAEPAQTLLAQLPNYLWVRRHKKKKEAWPTPLCVLYSILRGQRRKAF